MLRKGDGGKNAKSRGGKNGKAESIWKKFWEVSSTIFFLSPGHWCPGAGTSRKACARAGRGPFRSQ